MHWLEEEARMPDTDTDLSCVRYFRKCAWYDLPIAGQRIICVKLASRAGNISQANVHVRRENSMSALRQHGALWRANAL